MKTFLLLFALLICHPVLAKADFQELAIEATVGVIALITCYVLISVYKGVVEEYKRKKRNKSLEVDLHSEVDSLQDDYLQLKRDFLEANKKLKNKYKRLHQDFVDTLTAIQQYNVPTVPLEEVRAKIKDRLKEEESQPIPMPPFSFEVFGDNEGGYVAESWLHNGKHIEIKEPTLAKLKDSIRVVLSENINTDEMPESVKLVFVRKETFEL